MEPAASHDACNKAGGASQGLLLARGAPSIDEDPAVAVDERARAGAHGLGRADGSAHGLSAARSNLRQTCISSGHSSEECSVCMSVYSSLLLCTSALNLIEVAGVSIT